MYITVVGSTCISISSHEQVHNYVCMYTHAQLMCLIGEGFADSSDEVCGAVVQIRNKGDKIAIWTGNVAKEEDIMRIG